MSKISLVMPVYNAEDYLHYSIGSVLKQKYDNWELILVDDGSKDSSAKICDEYACQDSRILVIHKNNGGPSAARNIGLNMVHGQWIMFLDADDYLFDNALLILMEKVTSESVIIQFASSFFDPFTAPPGLRPVRMIYGKQPYIKARLCFL